MSLFAKQKSRNSQGIPLLTSNKNQKKHIDRDTSDRTDTKKRA